MEWYWWVLIVIGVIIIGYIKLKVLKIILNRKSKIEPDEEEI